MAHKFNPKNFAKLTRPDRLGTATPWEFLLATGLSAGMTFADIGCGPGFFTLPGAEIVSGVEGGDGMVYALDTEQDMLVELKKQTHAECIKIIQNKEESLPLEDSSVDYALLAYVLHELFDVPSFLKEIKRILKKNGIFVLIDWEAIQEEKGPPFADRISSKNTKELLIKAGFEVVEEKTLNPSHYFFVTKKTP